MITVVRCGKLVNPKTNEVRLVFRAPEYTEERRKGYVDMSSTELAQNLLESGGGWTIYCVKPKKGINAMVVVFTSNVFVSPSIREFESVFSPSKTHRAVLHHNLTQAEMLEIEQLECVRKQCASKIA